MTNTDQIPPTTDEQSDEERRAKAARSYLLAEVAFAGFLELKTQQLLNLQIAAGGADAPADANTAAVSRELGIAVIATQRIKEMNDSSRPTADDDADTIERKRDAFMRYADAFHAKLQQKAVERDRARAAPAAAGAAGVPGALGTIAGDAGRGGPPAGRDGAAEADQDVRP